MGDERTIVANQIGIVLLNSFKNSKTKKIALLEVLYAPDLGTNLLSVSKLNSKGYNVTFSYKGYATITNQKNDWLGIASLRDSMYCLQTSKPCDQSRATKSSIRSAKTAKAMKSLPIQLWHQRLGHLNYASIQSLSIMIDDIKISGSELDQNQDHELCIPCLEGKAIRKYEKDPSQRASRKLELIHSDLCRPFPTQSLVGSKYYIVFIDNATCYV